MKTLIKNIGTLAGILPAGVLRLEGEQMNDVASITNAYLLIEDGLISAFGHMEDCPGDSHAPDKGILYIITDYVLLAVDEK